MKDFNKKQAERAIKLMKDQKNDIKRIYDICLQNSIPYLTPAYKNVLDVLEQLLVDLENVYKNKEK